MMSSRLWASMLLDQVTLIDKVDWNTAQQDLMGMPMPEAQATAQLPCPTWLYYLPYLCRP